MNPLNTPAYNLFYHLNALNGLLFTLDGQLTSFDKLYRDSISEASFDISIIFSVSTLAIRDLTEWPESGVAIYHYTPGGFSTKGEEWLKLIKVFLARESAWTVSQAYETFETFLKDVSAISILENQGLVDTNHVEKFEVNKRSKNLTKKDFAFWREYIEYSYNKNEEILKFIRKICPDISKGEKENNRAIDLTEWFAVVGEVRNSATHSDFIIRAHKMKNWSRKQRDILNKYFSGIYENQEYKLNITIKDATFCLELFSEYAFQIYKFLSISRGYDWNILQKEKG